MEIIQTENFLERDATLVAIGKTCLCSCKNKSTLAYVLHAFSRKEKKTETALH